MKTHAVPRLLLILTVAVGLLGADWPQFHGPKRDNMSTETGLLKKWPEGGPKLLWRFTECGRGYAGVAIVDGTIYTVGDFPEGESLLALDLEGKLLWKTPNGPSWRGDIPGARTTPTYDKGLLYHLNPTGRLAVFEAKTGKEVWAVDLKKEYGAKWGRWAMSENILIDGDVLYVAPGGEKGRIVALEKATGKLVWANVEIKDTLAYCSPVLFTHKGKRQLMTILRESIVSVDPADGKLLWTHTHKTKHGQNVTEPLFVNGHIFASSGHGTGGRLLELNDAGDGVTELWLAKDLDNCHGGILLLDGRVVGSGCRMHRKGFVCADFKTGETLYNDKKLGKLSITYADGLLTCVDDKGKASLVKVRPDRFDVISQFAPPKGKRGLWLAHPVICGGTLYLRHGDDLFAYDVRAGAK
ncbi:PQQ-like beta-propeller repeat protein [bacterium]|nr:PQQ-like beta-propeller repeat protein [bacterium]